MYGFSPRALRKWADQIQFELDGDQRVASFDYVGSTCTSIEFNLRYKVWLDGRRIVRTAIERIDEELDLSCEWDEVQHLMGEPPPIQDLDEVLLWQPEVHPAGCLCEPAYRDHKWRFILQALHFALADD